MIEDVKKVITNLEGLIPVFGAFHFQDKAVCGHLKEIFEEVSNILIDNDFVSSAFGFHAGDIDDGSIVLTVSTASAYSGALESCSLLTDAELMTILDSFDVTKLTSLYEQLCARMIEFGYGFTLDGSFMIPVYSSRQREQNVAWEDIYPIYGNYILNVIHEVLFSEHPEVIPYYSEDFLIDLASDMDYPNHYDMGVIEVIHSINFPEEFKSIIEAVVFATCRVIDLEPAPVIYSPMEAL